MLTNFGLGVNRGQRLSVQSFEMMLHELRLLHQILERHDIGLRLALDLSEDDRSKAMVPASREAIDDLKKVENISEEYLERAPRCAICMCDYEIGSSVTELPCSHFFHGDCIEKWLERCNSCPVCREPISGTTEQETAAASATEAVEDSYGVPGRHQGNGPSSSLMNDGASYFDSSDDDSSEVDTDDNDCLSSVDSCSDDCANQNSRCEGGTYFLPGCRDGRSNANTAAKIIQDRWHRCRLSPTSSQESKNNEGKTEEFLASAGTTVAIVAEA